MKIAYILQQRSPISATFAHQEIVELQRQGVEVRVYPLSPQPLPEQEMAAAAALRAEFPDRFEKARAGAEAVAEQGASLQFGQAVRIAAELRRQPVQAVHADAVYGPGQVGRLIHQLIGLPYSIAAHAADMQPKQSDWHLLRRTLRDARFVVTKSGYDQVQLQRLMGGERADIRCLFPGVDPEQFQPVPLAERRPGRIIAVGRLEEQSGFDTLIRACALLRDRGVDFHCHIQGQGRLRQPLQTVITHLRLADRVELKQPDGRDGAAYHEAAVIAQPAVIGEDGRWGEPSLALLQAMAAGLPAVTTSVAGNPEIVDDGINGRIVPPDDAAALAYALAAILQNPARRARMGIAARQKVVRHYNIWQNVAQLRRWLAETPIPGAAYRPRALIIDSPYSPLSP